jgi:hypothetical protein
VIEVRQIGCQGHVQMRVAPRTNGNVVSSSSNPRVQRRAEAAQYLVVGRLDTTSDTFFADPCYPIINALQIEKKKQEESSFDAFLKKPIPCAVEHLRPLFSGTTIPSDFLKDNWADGLVKPLRTREKRLEFHAEVKRRIFAELSDGVKTIQDPETGVQTRCYFKTVFFAYYNFFFFFF